jgi:Ca-activated chloride channel family protein
MALKPDYFAVLGLTRQATDEEIRSAYHQAALRLHPDLNNSPAAGDQFLLVQEAYELLSNPEKRRAYIQTLPAEKTTAPPALVNPLYSRTTLSRSRDPQLIYALIDLTAPPGVDPLPRPPINLCLIIDRSTSMQGARMDTVKATAIELVRQTRPQDILSVVAFGDRAEVLAPSSQRLERSEIESNIRLLRTGGGTEIHRGLEAGFFEVRRHANNQYINHIILLTDGQTYGDEPACLTLADDAAAQGIVISGLGIGADWNDTFLDELAWRTGGISQFVSKSEEIRPYLQEMVRSLALTYADRVSLTLQTGAGVRLGSAFRIAPEAGPLPIESPLRLGSIPRNGSLSILFELIVEKTPDWQTEMTLAEGWLTMDVIALDQPGARVQFNLGCGLCESSPPEMPPMPLFQAMSSLNLYRMQERAGKQIAAGRVDKATRSLQNLATQLFDGGEFDLARTVIQEAERLRSGQDLTEEGKKRIKYGTRALMLPPGPIQPAATGPAIRSEVA